jgi:hypothetical protein
LKHGFGNMETAIFHCRFRITFHNLGSSLNATPSNDVNDVSRSTILGAKQTWGDSQFCHHVAQLWHNISKQRDSDHAFAVLHSQHPNRYLIY